MSLPSLLILARVLPPPELAEPLSLSPPSVLRVLLVPVAVLGRLSAPAAVPDFPTLLGAVAVVGRLLDPPTVPGFTGTCLTGTRS